MEIFCISLSQGFMVKAKNSIKKTTVELSEEQYFFLKEKALELQKQHKNYSIVSIIRSLIDEYCKKWIKERKSYGA